MRINASGNVGIGTTGAVVKLDVKGDKLSASFPFVMSVRDNDSGADSGGGGGIGFEGRRTISGSYRTYGLIKGNKETIETDNNKGGLQFFTRASGISSSLNEQMRIDGDGNVGIGTTAPDKNLEINNVYGNTSGTIGTGGILRLTYDDSDGGATTVDLYLVYHE